MSALNNKVNGSTLAEVLVAFVIVMLVFGMSVTLITQTYRTFPGLQDLRVMSAALKIREETMSNHTYEPQTIDVPGYRIEKKVVSSDLSENVLMLVVSAIPKDKHQKKITYHFVIPANRHER